MRNWTYCCITDETGRNRKPTAGDGGGVVGGNLFRSRVQETTGYNITAVHRGLGQDALNAGVYPAPVLAGGERGGFLSDDLITPYHTPPQP